MTTSDNVVVFARRPAAVELPLAFTELRLSDDGTTIRMTLYDQDRDVVAELEFTLSSKPQHFDLDLLRDAWARWRNSSTVTS